MVNLKFVLVNVYLESENVDIHFKREADLSVRSSALQTFGLELNVSRTPNFPKQGCPGALMLPQPEAVLLKLGHVAVLTVFLLQIIFSLESCHSDIFRKMTPPLFFSSFNWHALLLYCTKLKFLMVKFYQFEKPSTLK